MSPPLLALAAWRRRGDTHLTDALWAAACWEAAGGEADLVRARAIVAAAASCSSVFCRHAGADCLWWQSWHARRAAERTCGRGGEADRWELAAARHLATKRRAA